jgi:thiosulfate/3-mercaptopyruvate sulfurtransferase
MSEEKPASRWLVSTQWLQDHLDAPDIVVVDGSYYLPAMNRNAREEYLAAHIPGAVFLDIDVVKDRSSNLPHMMPSAEGFSSAMRELGIGDGQTVVVYDGIGLFSAPRVWWMFRVFGVREVLILDGGMPKWKAEGRPIDFGEVRRTPRHFTTRFDRGAIADLADVQKALAHPDIQVVDARSKARFDGTAAEPRPGLPSGHMPGALNLPWEQLLEDGRLTTSARISKAFADAGVDISQPIVTTCGSGVSAAILWFALDAIGKEPKALYDGSWTEWASRGDLPIETKG